MANEFKIKKGLIVTGASGGTVVDIQGSQGQLFSVTDDLSGSIFAVSDISGVPILDVNSSGLVTVDGPFTQTGGGATILSGTLNVEGVSTLANVGYLGDGLGSVQYTFQSANDGFATIDFGDVADSNVGRLSYNHNDNSFLIRTNNATALTLANNQNANFAGDVTVSGGDLNVGNSSTVNSVINMLGTNDSFIEKDTGNHLYFANNVGDKDIKFRIKDDTTNVIALTIDGSEGGDATFVAQAFSAATSSGDVSSTLTTKGYVDGLITGATIYRGAWQAGISATSSAATTASTTLTVTAAILDADGNTPVLVGAVVTGAGITGIVKVASVTSSTVYVLDTAITATATAYIFSPIYGAPDLSGVTETSGYYYICSEAGSATPNGANSEPNTWAVGDWCIYNDVSGTGQWQKIDNSSVLSGAGTGQTVALWEGPSSVTDSDTLGNAPITVSGSNVTFAGNIMPSAENLYNIGSASVRWEDIFADQVYGRDIYVDTKIIHNGDADNFIEFGTDTISISKPATFAGNISVADSARFEGTTNPITIGDGFGYGGSATICKHNTDIYIQYNNGQTDTNVRFGGGGTGVNLIDSENNNYKFTTDSADSYVLGGGGQFGIGTSSPNTPLHVVSNLSGPLLRLQNSSSGEESAIRFQTLDGTTPRYTDIAQSATTGNLDIRAPYNATIPNLTIKNGGDIGINISDPQAQLHISTSAPTPNTNAVTSLGVGLVVSGNDGLMDLLSYDDNTTVATSIGMGRYSQTTGNIIDKWGLVTWYDTGNEGSNLSERITLHYGTNKLPWNSTGMVTVLRDGNVGIGTSTPFTNAPDNNGLNIDRGGHSSLLIGDGVNDGGMIQSSDDSQRIIITANVYDSPTASWSRFTADGAALIDVYGEGSSAFISLNVDNGTAGFPAARLTVSNTGGIQFNTYGGTAKTGTPTYLLGTDASGNIVKTLTGVPTTGTTQFFNQSSLYNNTTPGITGYGDISMDTSVSYYDTGINVGNLSRGIVWTGKHYIITDYGNDNAKFFDNNFIAIPNPEAHTITLPDVGTISNAHGAGWDGRYLYCIVYAPATIVVYDLDNGTTTATIVNTQAMSNTTDTYDIEYAEGHLYTCADGKVSKYKVEGKTITHVFTSANILSGIEAQAITYDGSYLWITQNGNYAYKVSLDCVLVATITTGLPSKNVGWAWNGQNIAAVDHTTGDINIINTAATRFDTEKFLVMGGDVGIGIDAPTNKLHVYSDANEGIFMQGTGGGHWFNFQSGTSNLWSMGAQTGLMGWYNRTTGNVGYKMVILDNGNVGIGITGPTSKLHSVVTTAGDSALKLQDDTGSVFDFQCGIAGITGDALVIKDTSLSYDYLTLRSGNVGIGRTNPAVPLDVEGKIRSNDSSSNDYFEIFCDGSGQGDSYIENTSNNIQIKSAYATSFSTSGSAAMFIDNNQNVGIGTTTPLAKLDIQGTQGQLFSVTDDLSGSIFAVADISGVPIFDVNSSGVSYFDGNVGIGVTAPGEKLEVAGNMFLSNPGTSTSNNNSKIAINENLTGTPTFGYADGNSGPGQLVVAGYVSSGQFPGVMTLMNRDNSISANQDLGVIQFVGKDDATNGYASSQIIGTSSGTPGTGSSGGGILRFLTTPNSTGGAMAERMRIDNLGNVTIGKTTAALGSLDVAGTLVMSVSTTKRFQTFYTSGYTFINGGVSGNDIYFGAPSSYTQNIRIQGTATATNFILSSDKTLKDNIEEIDTKHIDVSWKNFELKSEPGVKRSGVIAQELEEKHPEFVRTDKDGLKSVAYIDLLIAKIAELEARLEKAGI